MNRRTETGVTLQSVNAPDEEWVDWRTQRHPSEEVSRARKALGELLDALDRLPMLVLVREKTQRTQILPPSIALWMLAGIGMPRHTVEELVKLFKRRGVSEEITRQVRNEALRILRGMSLIAAPRIEELREEFYDLVFAAQLPETAVNNLAPEWKEELKRRELAA